MVDENVDLVKEAVDEREAEQVEKDIRPLKKPRTAASPAEEQPRPPRPDAKAAQASAEHAEQPKKPYAPIRMEVPGTHFTQEQASALCPYAKGCTISPVNGRQWQIKYKNRPCRPYSHSVTYEPTGEAGLTNHRTALLECLEWARGVHTNECGQPAFTFNLRQAVGLE